MSIFEEGQERSAWLETLFGATAVSMPGVDATRHWASDWGWLIGSVLSAFATIAAGAFAR